MVLDTSALVAILWNEPERATFEAAIAKASRVSVSAVTVFEAGLVLERDGGPASATILDRLLVTIEANVVPFDATSVAVARRAYREFGKGRHPAGLNFGDCFAYGLARTLGEPLLFKGSDFGRTDISDAMTNVSPSATSQPES